MGRASAGPSPGYVVATAAACVYLWLVPNGVGWRDAGELGTAAQVLGVPHPTGFTLDMIALKAGALLPFGTIAFRQNLVVALVSALALGLLAELIHRVASELLIHPMHASAGAIFGAAGLGCWATFLGTALAVEVYSTALVVVLGAVVILSRPSRAGVLLLGLLAGLSLSVHVTARLYLLPLFAVALWRARTRHGAVMAALGLALVGALALVYLPLSSLRNPPLDWGDPETLSRFWEYISAGRIRSAYSEAMMAPRIEPAAALGGQLAELWPLLLPALVAALASIRRARGWLLAMLVFAAVDLSYATLIHPMGVVDRQVGHLTGAIIACLAGVGAAFALERANELPSQRASIRIALGLLVVFLVLGAPEGLGADAEVPDELHGAGGNISWVAPRSIVVCSSDDVCAISLFALHAEGARPDVSAIPAQHLWEPNVRALISEGSPAFAEVAALRPEAGPERALLAERSAFWLAEGGSGRPVRWEGTGRASPVGKRLVPSDEGSWLRVWTREGAVASDALAGLDGAVMARLGGVPALTTTARRSWSRAYGNLGRGYLGGGDPRLAVVCFERAIDEAPERAPAHTNLGVARATVGDWDGAIEAAARAIELDPEASAAWSNLATYLARVGRVDDARGVIERARVAGVRDIRLDQLAEILGR